MTATKRAGANAHFPANNDLNLDNTIEIAMALAVMIASTIRIETGNRHACHAARLRI
jgi:hypothetical protein